MADQNDRASAVTPEVLSTMVVRECIGRRLALFLDFDGTLTPVVARPELAKLPEKTRASLRALAKIAPIAVISGRKREDVARLVGLSGLYYVGSHGFDIAGPDGRILRQEGQAFTKAVADAERQLRHLLTGLNGAVVENKTFSVAVHYRLVDPGDMPRLRAAVDAALRGHPELHETAGKRVIDLRPRIDWDKGKAVLWLADRIEADGIRHYPIYIGDDMTDEDAFRALEDRGLTVLVADTDRRSHARYRLKDTDAVKRFLDILLSDQRD